MDVPIERLLAYMRVSLLLRVEKRVLRTGSGSEEGGDTEQTQRHRLGYEDCKWNRRCRNARGAEVWSFLTSCALTTSTNAGFQFGSQWLTSDTQEPIRESKI